MKRSLVLLLVILLVVSMASPAFAKSNSINYSSKTNMFLAIGYWEDYGCDDEYCWGSYQEVFVRDENPKSDYVTLEILLYEYRYPIWWEEPEYPEGGMVMTEEGDEFYWNSFQIPREDFKVGKKLTEGAVLDTLTADGPVHLIWTIDKTNKEKYRTTYQTKEYRFSYKVNSTYGTGSISGHIFGDVMGESAYAAMGYVSTFEKVRQTY